MLFIWLRYVKVFGNLTEADTLCVLVDNKTKEYLEDLKIQEMLGLSVTFVEFEQPCSAQEGTQYRYKIYESCLVDENTCVCYTDVDMLVIKDIHWVERELTSKNLLVYPEYTLRHFTYLGELTEDDMVFFDEFPELYMTHPGMTSTFFGFRGFLMKEPFQDLLTKMKSSETVNYTLDQPFFNRMVLWHCYKKEALEISFLEKNTIVYNQIRKNCDENVCLLNYCGEPGNQEYHWMKMFMAVLSEIHPA